MPLAVIIPARNEEARLGPLLESLQAQTVRPAQLLVSDDGSSDRTAALAREHGATVVTCRPSPDGWRGKNWACAEGARAASAEALLFLDADTRLEPSAVEVISHFLSQHSGALSLQPYHEVKRAYEQLSGFFNVVQLMSSGAFTMFGSRLISQRMFGPVLAVRRTDYEAFDGHASVRREVLENVVLSEKLREKNIPFSCASGRGLVSFRMYADGFRDLVNGWTKSFATGAGHLSPFVLALVLGWFTGALGTFRHLVTASILGSPERAWVALLYGLYVLQIAWMQRQAGRFWFLTALCYPVGMIFFVGVFVRSLFLTWFGGERVWKGRKI